MQSWFLFMTKPNRERYAAENVRLQSFRFLLPEFFDKAKQQIAVLFPSYLFVCTKTPSYVSTILSTRGISSVVRMGEDPCRVQQKVIDALRGARDKKTKLITFAPPRRHYRFNQRVVVTSGPFLDQLAQYQYADEQRVFVLMTIMGHKVTVPLDEQQLSAA